MSNGDSHDPMEEDRGAGGHVEQQRGGLWLPLACCWLLMFNNFSVPGREGPDSLGAIDLIGLAKAGTRGLIAVVLAFAVLASWREARRRRIVWSLLPLGIYTIWAFTSVAWSPLVVVSLGQAMGLAAFVLLALVLALRWRGPEDTSAILFHLSLGLLTVAGIVLAAFAVSPEWSGLDRTVSIEGSVGLMHPTAAGSTAAMGILVLVVAWLVWGWRWTKVLMLLGLPAHGLLLYLAASRVALATSGCAVLLAAALLARRESLAVAVLAIGVAVAGYLAVDPCIDQAGDVVKTVAEYARRGDSDEQMSSLNGRTDLWSAIWNEYVKSPVVGHGYYVCSPSGEIDVWSGPANRTAHNVLLQVLMSTGIVGLAIFLWGLFQPVCHCARRLPSVENARGLGRFLFVLSAWYAAWGQLSSSFMEGVQPEVVVFFACLGMALGAAWSEPGDADGRRPGSRTREARP